MAVVKVALMVGANFDPFSIMTCKQSVMETNLVRYVHTLLVVYRGCTS